MRKKYFALLITALFFPITLFGTNETTVLDNEQIIDLTNNYILLLQKTINQRLGEFLAEMNQCFNDPIANDHTYDLSNKLSRTFIASYLLDAMNDKELVEFEAVTEDLEILPCTYFDPSTSKLYTYVKLPKIMIRKGNKTRNYSHYLSINVSYKNYVIEAVYDDVAETHQKYIAPCMKETLDAEKQKELAITITKKYDQVTQLYSQTKYLDALVILEEILEINQKHQESLDAKDAIFDLIDVETIDKKINESLATKELTLARTTLTLSQIYKIGTTAQILGWAQLIEKAEVKIQQEFDFKKAENFFKNQMYQQALLVYLVLKRENFNSNIIESRIKTCREADPRFVQNKIKQAYEDVVKSEGKEADNTFKTYYKYENSGYLNGDNFKFMCQMMLSSGNRRLLKDMNISPKQSKNLAIKYFYKAKNMGEDTKDIEFRVFTRNFNKKRKN